MPPSKRQPLIENGIVVGTGSNKYEMKNPIARHLLKGFDNAIADFAARISPATLTEIGCGEGYVTKILLERTAALITALDISDTLIDITRRDLQSPRVIFENRNIYDIDQENHSAELVVCCEVLEHLEHPRRGLERLAAVASPFALMSVPREPIWRAMNFARGAYFSDFGNSPGHVQHWSKKAFLKFVQQEFDIMEVRSPLPWTVVLGRSRQYCGC